MWHKYGQGRPDVLIYGYRNRSVLCVSSVTFFHRTPQPTTFTTSRDNFTLCVQILIILRAVKGAAACSFATRYSLFRGKAAGA